MRICNPGSLLITFLLLASCEGGWSNEYKQEYLSVCKTENQSLVAAEQLDSYCDCSLKVLMKHYKTMEEVIVNKDAETVRAEIEECKGK